MYNWNTDTSTLKKNPTKYVIWKLEQMINFGLDGERLDRKQVIKFWDKLKIDPKRRKVLSFWLWPKQF